MSHEPKLKELPDDGQHLSPQSSEKGELDLQDDNEKAQLISLTEFESARRNILTEMLT